MVEAPVAGAQPCHVAEIDDTGSLAVGELGGVLHHGQDVAQVILVHRRALQFDEQDVARGDGVGLEL